MIRIQRGTFALVVPIGLVGLANGEDVYFARSIWVAGMALLLDSAVGEYMDWTGMFRRDRLWDAMGGRTGEEENHSMSSLSSSLLNQRRRKHRQRRQKKEERLLEREKMKVDAVQQIRLMSKPAEVKRTLEEGKKGLVIMKATYGVTVDRRRKGSSNSGGSGDGGCSIDVTVALQFWVANSALHLPATETKSSMLGFYDLRNGGDNDGVDGDGDGEDSLINGGGVWKACQKIWQRMRYANEEGEEETQRRLRRIPTLTVRYRFRDDAYEITILDHEPLSLPSDKAMKLGGVHVC